MKALDHKIPPPAVLLLTLALMKGVAHFDKGVQFSGLLGRFSPAIALLMVLAGVSCALLGMLQFRAHQTTVNPLQPERASSLVTSGVFRFSRNPMYLGLALLSLAWGVYLGSVWALAGVLGFVWFINRYQIQPEERVMGELFGHEFDEYCSRTRRWF